jgi:hypothetical protein
MQQSSLVNQFFLAPRSLYSGKNANRGRILERVDGGLYSAELFDERGQRCATVTIAATAMNGYVWFNAMPELAASTKGAN